VTISAAAGPAVDGHGVTFRYDDPDRRLTGVRLCQDVGVPGVATEFRYDDDARAWWLRLDRPAVWRFEYLLELRHPDGGTETVTDPGNPRRAPGAFGDKSVAEFPDYREPGWLHAPDHEHAGGGWREHGVWSAALSAHVATRIWSPAARTTRLLLANDGPEYDRLAALGRYAATMVGTGRVPPFHLALLAPADRNRWYAAEPDYAWALARDVLPELHRTLGTAGPAVGMGASLGGLSMLHAQRRYPAAFAGLFLQSGSFFVPEYDRHESDFSGYRRIVRFTARVASAGSWRYPVPTVLTAGLGEENLHNNRWMAARLAEAGYPVTLREVPDAHNYVGWRDAFDPHLTDLLVRVWG
jgi:enterochelin esterase family protein